MVLAHRRHLVSLYVTVVGNLVMPLTESGRAFWSLDETEALLAAAPRWGFSAAKLRENVPQLSHFSTKQVSSKLADLQIQNRGGSRAAAMKKKSSGTSMGGGVKSERLSELQEAQMSSMLITSSSYGHYDSPNEMGYEPASPGYSQPGSPGETPSAANPKKRDRSFATEFSSPDSKRSLLFDNRLQNRLPYAFPGTTSLASVPTLPALSHAAHFPTTAATAGAFPFSSAAAAAAAAASGLMIPPLLGLSGTSHLFPAADKLTNHLEAGTVKRSVLLKEGFQAPAGTKPSLIEVPHPSIRCYSSPDIFKIVINPVLFGTTIEVLVPQEAGGHAKALLKIDWKLAATPFDADFDFRRHPSLTELYLCPLPANVNPTYSYSLHTTADAMCIIFALNRPVFSNIESALAALSTLAAASVEEGPATASSSSTTTASTASSSATVAPADTSSSSTIIATNTASTSSPTTDSASK